MRLDRIIGYDDHDHSDSNNKSSSDRDSSFGVSPSTASALAKITGVDAKSMLDNAPDEKNSVIIGVNENHTPVSWNFSQYSILDVLGPVGSGKTVLLNGIIRQLAKHKDYVVTVRPRTYTECRWIDDLHLVNTEIVNSSEDAINQYYDELLRRLSLLDPCKEFFDDDTNRTLPEAFLILDESGKSAYSNIVPNEKSGCFVEKFRKLVGGGRLARMHVILIQDVCVGDRTPSLRFESEMIGAKWGSNASIDSLDTDAAVLVFGKCKINVSENGDRKIYNANLSRKTGNAVLCFTGYDNMTVKPVSIPYYSMRALRKELAPYCWQLPEAFKN